jgi:hypothetical protein
MASSEQCVAADPGTKAKYPGLQACNSDCSKPPPPPAPPTPAPGPSCAIDESGKAAVPTYCTTGNKAYTFSTAACAGGGKPPCAVCSGCIMLYPDCPCCSADVPLLHQSDCDTCFAKHPSTCGNFPFTYGSRGADWCLRWCVFFRGLRFCVWGPATFMKIEIMG